LDVCEAIQGRRSIRSFKSDPVPEDLIRKLILEAGIWAPTGGTAQTWRFVVVTDPSRRGLPQVTMGKCSRSARHFRSFPLG
jgi:nitroreductase